jgi:hypothetical protein
MCKLIPERGRFVNLLNKALVMLLTKLASESEQQEHLNYDGKDLFAMPLPEQLQQPIQSLKAWLHSTTQTVQICKATYAAEIAYQHNDIRYFLPPVPVPTTILTADFGDNDSDSDYSNKPSSSTTVTTALAAIAAAVQVNQECCTGSTS